jgi:hypothetical protein
MDKKELQKRLSKPYTTDNWKEVVQFVFPNVQLLNPPMVIPIDNDKVETFKQIGNVQLHDGKTLALFELKLKEKVNILRNRVELNNLVSNYIDQDQTHGVLSIFEQGGDDYRFSFSARASEFDEEEGDFKTKKTDTKRFTYVLGKNETCKTPAQRFFDLSEHKDKADIKAIEDAFSVEKLSKLFFKEYKEQYNRFVSYMMQTPGIYTAVFKNDDKKIRDFVKIFLGRIIFIKFVQKKGWMGVPATEKDWKNGDYRFLENAFAQFEHQDLFYANFLNPLFFKALDKPNRPNDVFDLTNTKVPYLSGGLFENDEPITQTINFPTAYFQRLFEFLDHYNFTIDENDTNDHEVGIDPEMLGHIFENLLEDNKDKGAFYTPKEIVRYMCQESLKEYLKTSLENNKQWPTEKTEAVDFEQALHNFVTKKEAGGVIEFEETIARALKEVKICDPAIGSGAFPMGLLNEIFHLVHTLHEASGDKLERIWELKGWQPNLVKQSIIQNSIYGVDIEKGAVDVARLRFWLSLIVDEPEPKALPHLEYKIVVGNSLVSKLDDTVIDIDWQATAENLPETDLFGKAKPKQFNAFEVDNNEKQKQLLEQISKKQKAVFDPNSDEEKLSLEIRNLKIDLLSNQLDAMVKTKGVALEPKGPGKNIKAQTELWLQTLGWKNQIIKLEKLKKQPDAPLLFFDWKLDFPEIMNEQVSDKVGFDIVIANPPYIKEYTNKNVFDGFRESKYYQGKMDLWYGFACKMIDILKPNGIECFIAQNNWITSAGASILRKKVLEETKILNFVDFGNYKVFNTAGIQTMIYLLKNKKNKCYDCKYSILENDKISTTQLIHFIDFEQKNDYSNKFLFQIKAEDLQGKSISFNDNKLIIILEKILSKSNFSLNDKEVANGIHPHHDFLSKKHIEFLDEKFKVGTGVFGLTNFEKENLNLTKKENELIKPYFTTEQFDRYYANQKNKLWLIYTSSKFKKKEEILPYPNIKNHLDKFKKIITSDNKPYGLHRTRDEKFFIGEKIIVQRKCPKKPIFTYTDFDAYVSATFYIIKTSRLNQKYLVGLLNSLLIEFWLRNKGKMQGFNFQIDKEPIVNIPILNPTINIQDKISFIVEEIIRKKHKNLDTNNLELQIDNLVYKLYELNYDEVLVVEPAFSERMSEEEYDNLKVE